jgi:hypothetical protein
LSRVNWQFQRFDEATTAVSRKVRIRRLARERAAAVMILKYKLIAG